MIPVRPKPEVLTLSTTRRNWAFKVSHLLEGRAAGVDLVHQVLDANDAVLPQNLHSKMPQHHA